MDEAREQVERQAPDALDKMAATARNIGQRLDDMASDVRHRAEEEKQRRNPPKPSDRAPEPSSEPQSPRANLRSRPPP